MIIAQPASFMEMIALEKLRIVMTDSGGVQRRPLF